MFNILNVMVTFLMATDDVTTSVTLSVTFLVPSIWRGPQAVSRHGPLSDLQFLPEGPEGPLLLGPETPPACGAVTPLVNLGQHRFDGKTWQGSLGSLMATLVTRLVRVPGPESGRDPLLKGPAAKNREESPRGDVHRGGSLSPGLKLARPVMNENCVPLILTAQVSPLYLGPFANAAPAWVLEGALMTAGGRETGWPLTGLPTRTTASSTYLHNISCESTTPPPACGGATFGIDNYNDSDKDYCGDSDGDNYGDIDNDDYVDIYADSDKNHCGGSDGDNNGDIDNDNYDDGWSWHTILLGAFLGAALNPLVEIVETVMARCGASPTPWRSVGELDAL